VIRHTRKMEFLDVVVVAADASREARIGYLDSLMIKLASEITTESGSFHSTKLIRKLPEI